MAASLPGLTTAPTGASPPLKVLGRYALHEAIASGGMATVHFGRLLGPVGFARTVAIKRLHERLAQDPEFTSMFLDEARLAARIRHPNVVPTLDVVSMDNELFLVMEYVQGESLGRLYRRENDRKTRMKIPLLATLIAGALHGLHAAHEATSENGEPLGLIHRDVSPQNILVGVDGVARVLDFGVAKAAGRASTTRDGQLKGKLSYMAPEQLRGKNITRGVDIYAAGVVLWEGLVGRKLYKADSEAELVTLVVEANVEPPSKAAPPDAGISPELDALVLKACARDPAHRFATAREMAKALEKLIPPVPASDIGEYVEEVAGIALAARTQRISLIERSSTSDVTAIAGSEHATAEGPLLQAAPSGSQPPTISASSLSATPEASLTNASAIEIPVHGPRGKKMYVIAVVSAIALASVIALTILSFSSRTNVTASTTPVPASSPQSSSTTPPTSSPATSAAVVEPSSSSAAQSASSAVAVEPPPSASAAKTAAKPIVIKPAGTPVATPAKPTATAPAPNCDPPYVVDANGVRRYKRECAR